MVATGVRLPLIHRGDESSPSLCESNQVVFLDQIRRTYAVVSFPELGSGVETGGVGAAYVGAVELSGGATGPGGAQPIQLVGTERRVG